MRDSALRSVSPMGTERRSFDSAATVSTEAQGFHSAAAISTQGRSFGSAVRMGTEGRGFSPAVAQPSREGLQPLKPRSAGLLSALMRRVAVESIDRGDVGSVGNGGTSGGGGESQFSGAAGVPQRTYVTGMVIALGGIAMFFVALVSAWIVRKGFPNNDWQRLEIPLILWPNTAILLASSFTLARSRRYFLARQEDGFRHWWGVTAILGIFFLAGQVIAWWQLASAGVFLATNPSSSFFYVFTAAHGLHLLGGVAALLAVPLWPARRLTRATLTEVVAIYWHFMDGLWLFLFVLLVVGK